MDDEFVEAPIAETFNPPSFIEWLVTMLGYQAWLLPIAAITTSVMIWRLSRRGRNEHAYVAATLLVPAPLMIGVFGAFDGLFRAFAASPTGDGLWITKALDGLVLAIFAPWVGLLFTVPGYVLAIMMIFKRTRSTTEEGVRPQIHVANSAASSGSP